MSPRQLNLWSRAIHMLRRSGIWWTLATVFFVVLNAAFWPSLKGSEALKSFEDMGALLEAFGAQNIGTPAGYLDGQLFAFMLPGLLSAMAIAQCSAVTAGDEDAGRLELVHALPTSRQAVWFCNWLGSVTVLCAVTAVVVVSALLSLVLFSFDGVNVGNVVAATIACGCLAAFHGAVAYAAAGLGLSRGKAVGVAAAALMTGYVVGYVLPIAASLGGVRNWSPWYWAIAQQPVTNGIRPAFELVLLFATSALVLVGTLAVNRRDIRSA